MLDTETGEVQARRLAHDDQTVEHFYASLPRPVTVGVESTGYAQWFHALIQRQGHTLLVGDAARIRAMVVRKTKTDRRDAAHLLQLLSQDRFPVIWVPDPRVRDLRVLVTHRMRLVRMRTMVKNGLHAIALNQRLAAGSALFTRRGRAQLQALALPPHTTQRRDESLALLTWLDAHIDPLNAQIAEAANADDQARRLMTHPGVGPLTALATVLVLGPVARFPDQQARGELHWAGAVRGRLGRQVPAGSCHQARQRRASLRAWVKPARSRRGPMPTCDACTRR